MREKVKIIVFGLHNQPVSSDSCDCGPGGCGPSPITGELYSQLINYLAQSDIADAIEISFVDVFMNGLAGFDRIEQLMNKGHRLPITSVADKKFFSGGINNQKIYEAAMDILKADNV